MLGKLLKYDLKWVYKELIIFYIITLVFSVIARLFGFIENSVIFSILKGVCSGIAVGTMIGCLINCVMRLWIRFIQNSYKDEAYLTHTIPVQKKTIYLSKVISALITIFTTAIMIVSCLFICYYSQANMEIVKSALDLKAGALNTTTLKLLLLVSIVITLQVIFIVMTGYAGIILGHKSNKNKILKSVAIAFGMYMMAQVVSIIFVLVLGLLNSDFMNLINTTEAINVETIKALMYGAIGLYAVYLIFYYMLSKMQFAKGVNIE